MGVDYKSVLEPLNLILLYKQLLYVCKLYLVNGPKNFVEMWWIRENYVDRFQLWENSFRKLNNMSVKLFLNLPF